MQASVDAGDEYAPFFLGTMYMSGHIDDEDAGYNGMRFLAIAANRGAEGVEKEIAEHRLNFAKCYTAFQYNFLCLADDTAQEQY